MTCRNIAGVCPGTEVTLCICSISSVGLLWILPGRQILFDNNDNVGAEKSSGAYTATINDDTEGRVSVLTYTATTTLMGANIQCQDTVGTNPPPTTVTVTLAGMIKQMIFSNL